jgi:hypothetical protein
VLIVRSGGVAICPQCLGQLQVNNVMAQKKYLPAAQPAAPTGLTVSPDPQNGTVLHLTWRDNADNKAFEVDNTVERRDASARPGTGTVHYTWTGLRPGSRACFRDGTPAGLATPAPT